MNLNWSNRVIKYVLFVFNLLFVISGIIMIAVGVSVKEYYTEYDVFLNDSYFSLPNLLIAIGSLIFFISFFGCCGAIRESWFMIFIFSILLSLIFIMEFSAGIAGYVLRDNTASFLETELAHSMKNYRNNQNKTNPTTVMWDAIQRRFQCCGPKNPEDWPKFWNKDTTSTTATIPTTSKTPSTPSIPSTSSTPSTSTTADTADTSTTTSSPTTKNSRSLGERRKRELTDAVNLPYQLLAEPVINHKLDLPMSCCKSRAGTTGNVVCNLNDTTTAIYYKRGCVVGFGDYLKEHAITIGGVGIAIALIQLVGVIFACHLARQLKHGFYST